ncbi:uncharacterized protein LOC122245321 [Penaeus japonicus]|uniref:uncharacterized protein LOC122245321 n=1 Tax=Penaeus japonicus TaxID=27405 RepID=UPI001C715A1C|nr:uncharacterized protein LOC122245321 [Penaeus japonicus]
MKLTLAFVLVLVASLVVGLTEAHGRHNGWGRGGGGGGGGRGGDHSGGCSGKHGRRECITSLCQSATAGLDACKSCIWNFKREINHNCFSNITDCSAMNATALTEMKNCLTQLKPEIGPCFA